MRTVKSYSELIEIPDYLGRLNYLQCNSTIGDMTFGGQREINQRFYRSPEWRRFRREIIMRDLACDMAIEGYEISTNILIHHINPITIEDLTRGRGCVIDPENVVCVSHQTHNQIHYGVQNGISNPYEINLRTPNDTCPWKR